jgi:hypothetical protein
MDIDPAQLLLDRGTPEPDERLEFPEDRHGGKRFGSREVAHADREPTEGGRDLTSLDPELLGLIRSAKSEAPEAPIDREEFSLNREQSPLVLV